MNAIANAEGTALVPDLLAGASVEVVPPVPLPAAGWLLACSQARACCGGAANQRADKLRPLVDEAGVELDEVRPRLECRAGRPFARDSPTDANDGELVAQLSAHPSDHVDAETVERRTA